MLEAISEEEDVTPEAVVCDRLGVRDSMMREDIGLKLVIQA